MNAGADRTDRAAVHGAGTPPTPEASHRWVSTRTLLVTGLVVALLLAGVVSYYASSHPDGLSFVADRLGISSTQTPHASDGSPLSGYATRGVGNERLSKGVAGVLGVVLVGAIGSGLFWVLRRRSSVGERGED